MVSMVPSSHSHKGRSGDAAGEIIRSRAELIKVLLEELRPGWILPKGVRVAQFKARMQELGRISVPEAERDVLGLQRGDIVQVLLWKAKPEVGD